MKLLLLLIPLFAFGQTNLPGPIGSLPDASSNPTAICSWNTSILGKCAGIVAASGITSNWKITVSDTNWSFDHAVFVTGNVTVSSSVSAASYSATGAFTSNATGTSAAFFTGSGSFLVQANGVTDIAGNVTIGNPATLTITALGGLGTIGACFNNAGTLVTCSGSGVTSLNSLTGALSIAGTTNQINVSAGGSTITLSTPQNIDTSANVTFNTVTSASTISSGGTIVSNAAGTAFFTGSGSFLVSGAGAVSMAGIATIPAGVLGPITTPIGGAASTIQIGASGNFWTRPITNEAGLSCSGVPDAFFAIAGNSGAPTLLACFGGSRYHVAVTSY